MNITYGKGFSASRIDPDALLVREGGEVRFNVPDRTPAVIRQRIHRLTELLLSLDDKTEFPVTHTLIDGIYTRRLFIPKGSILVGKIHLKECVNILAGEMSILTETGSGRFSFGHVAVSGPGIQKVGYAHEDSYFFNVFRTDETDIAKIEAEIASETYPALECKKVEELCL